MTLQGARLMSHTKLTDDCIKTVLLVTHQLVEQDVWRVTVVTLNILQVVS